MNINPYASPVERHLKMCEVVKELVKTINEKDPDMNESEIDFYTHLLGLELKDLFNDFRFNNFRNNRDWYVF